jgi:hypothetical protein
MINKLAEIAAGFLAHIFLDWGFSVGLTPDSRTLSTPFSCKSTDLQGNHPWVQNTSCNRRPRGLIPGDEGRQVGALWAACHREGVRCAVTGRKTDRS